MAVIPPEAVHNDYPAPKECTFCGERAVAFWMCGQDLGVCRRCALKVLPSLIADAVCQDRLTPHRTEISSAAAAWGEAEKHYWYAIACSLNRAGHVQRVKADALEVDPCG